MGRIIYNGISSADLHVLVQHPPEYVIPERDYEVTHVPGRDGDILVDQGSWRNVERSYNLAIDARKDGYSAVAGAVARWLHSASGYARLEDSYEPEYYRMAMYKDTVDISNIAMQAGVFNATFNCKPQRFLKAGERVMTFDTWKPLRNPTLFDSYPNIIVYGSGHGEIYLGGQTIKVNEIVNGMVIDSELQDAYHNLTNCNSKIELVEFPRLKPGNTDIVFTDGITQIDIVPRWWTL